MRNTSENPEVAGTCTDLDAADVERVTAFMAEAARAFAIADAALLVTLFHAGGDPRNYESSREFNQRLMDGGDRVRNWSARPSGWM